MPKRNAVPGKDKSAKLLYASTETSADMLYFAGVFVPDPYIAIELGRKRIGVVSMLEFARVQRESRLTEVLPLEKIRKEAITQFKVKNPGPCEWVRLVAKRYGIAEFVVPFDFPAGLAAKIMEAGLKVTPVEGAFFPKRIKKSAVEADAIREGNAACSAGFRAAEKTLNNCRIGKRNQLVLGGKVLTSERLRTIIDTACLEHGGVASHTICAGGHQACDPHESGHGPLYADQLIIIDIFPRITRSGYHGDMTRTYLKGRANDAQKRLVKAVKDAQEAALSTLKAGLSGKKVHLAAADCFKRAGYKTEQVDQHWQGFIHSTGHGLGLEIHEEPRVSPTGKKLPLGAVVTIEPGLYYPDIGGCRIEDVAWVKGDGYELLSNYPYRWQIR